MRLLALCCGLAALLRPGRAQGPGEGVFAGWGAAVLCIEQSHRIGSRPVLGRGSRRLQRAEQRGHQLDSAGWDAVEVVVQQNARPFGQHGQQGQARNRGQLDLHELEAMGALGAVGVSTTTWLRTSRGA